MRDAPTTMSVETNERKGLQNIMTKDKWVKTGKLANNECTQQKDLRNESVTNTKAERRKWLHTTLACNRQRRQLKMFAIATSCIVLSLII